MALANDSYVVEEVVTPFSIFIENISDQYLEEGEFAGFSIKLQPNLESSKLQVDWFRINQNNEPVELAGKNKYSLLVGPVKRDDFCDYFCRIYYDHKHFYTNYFRIIRKTTNDNFASEDAKSCSNQKFSQINLAQNQINSQAAYEHSRPRNLSHTLSQQAGYQIQCSNNNNNNNNNNNTLSHPMIIMQPRGGYYKIGTDVILQSRFADARIYQWYRNGSSLVGCVGEQLTIHGVMRSNEGLFHVTAYNTNGETSSYPTLVTVYD